MTAPNGSELLRRLLQLKRAATKIQEVSAADARRAMVSGLFRDLRKLGDLSLTSLPAEEAALLRELYELADHLAEGRFPVQLRRLEQTLNPQEDGLAPQVPFWVRMGVPRIQAQTLEKVGLHNLDDVSRLTREQFLAFHGLGRETLSFCEGLLGRPLPSEEPMAEAALSLDREARLGPAQWRSLGFGAMAANTFARMGMTLARLSEWSEEDFLSRPGLGVVTLAAVERLIGRRLVTESQVFVQWVGLGLGRMAARRLQAAKLRTLDDLRGKSLSDLKRLGLGLTALRRLGVLLGGLPVEPAPPTSIWKGLGLGTKIERALMRAGVMKPEDLARVTREEILLIPRLGPVGVQLLEQAIGRTFPSSTAEWRRLGCSPQSAECLSLHHIMTLEDFARRTPLELLRLGVDWRDVSYLMGKLRGGER